MGVIKEKVDKSPANTHSHPRKTVYVPDTACFEGQHQSVPTVEEIDFTKIVQSVNKQTTISPGGRGRGLVSRIAC